MVLFTCRGGNSRMAQNATVKLLNLGLLPRKASTTLIPHT